MYLHIVYTFVIMKTIEKGFGEAHSSHFFIIVYSLSYFPKKKDPVLVAGIGSFCIEKYQDGKIKLKFHVVLWFRFPTPLPLSPFAGKLVLRTQTRLLGGGEVKPETAKSSQSTCTLWLYFFRKSKFFSADTAGFLPQVGGVFATGRGHRRKRRCVLCFFRCEASLAPSFLPTLLPLANHPNPYFNLLKIDSPIVPSGIFTPKLSTIVAPITAKVFWSSSLPLPVMDGEYHSIGTISLV